MEQKRQQQAAGAPAEKKEFADLTVPAPDVPTLGRLFKSVSVQTAIAEALPKHMSPERMTRVMLTCCRKIPKLAQAPMQSLISALVQCSELGLEPGSALGHVYLIPFEKWKKDKFGKWVSESVEIQVIIGFKGFVELARRSGKLKSISARIVHEKDKFEVRFGLDEKLEHVPFLEGDPGAPKFAYCVALFLDGGYHFEVMSIPEIEKIRNESKAYKQALETKKPGIWDLHFEEMCKKTVVRRSSKYFPLSSEDAERLESADESMIVDGKVVSRDAVAGMLADNLRAPPKPDDVVIPFPSVPPESGSEAHDATTGEVSEADPATESIPVSNEPPDDPIDALIWRIKRANGPELGVISREVAKLSKDEPRRIEVARAIGARQNELRAAEQTGGAQ